LLNERENDVEPIVVVHASAGQPVGEKATDPIRSTSFPALGALAAISLALIDCQSPSS
jgi:hypothetical protein